MLINCLNTLLQYFILSFLAAYSLIVSSYHSKFETLLSTEETERDFRLFSSVADRSLVHHFLSCSLRHPQR